jgi:hypothetical protein
MSNGFFWFYRQLGNMKSVKSVPKKLGYQVCLNSRQAVGTPPLASRGLQGADAGFAITDKLKLCAICQ